MGEATKNVKKSEIYVDDTSFMGLGGCLGGCMVGVWLVWGLKFVIVRGDCDGMW